MREGDNYVDAAAHRSSVLNSWAIVVTMSDLEYHSAVLRIPQEVWLVNILPNLASLRDCGGLLSVSRHFDQMLGRVVRAWRIYLLCMCREELPAGIQLLERQKLQECASAMHGFGLFKVSGIEVLRDLVKLLNAKRIAEFARKDNSSTSINIVYDDKIAFKKLTSTDLSQTTLQCMRRLSGCGFVRRHLPQVELCLAFAADSRPSHRQQYNGKAEAGDDDDDSGEDDHSSDDDCDEDEAIAIAACLLPGQPGFRLLGRRDRQTIIQYADEVRFRRARLAQKRSRRLHGAETMLKQPDVILVPVKFVAQIRPGDNCLIRWKTELNET